MSTRPEAGSPDELMWLRGFEEARNQFLAENKRLREALKIYADPFSAKDEDGDNIGVPDFWVETDISRFAIAALEQK